MQNYRKITLKNIFICKAQHPIVFLSLIFFSLQLEIHRFLPFGIMAGLALGAAMLCMTLPETHNKPTIENLKYDPEEQLLYEKDEVKTAKDGEGEGSPL